MISSLVSINFEVFYVFFLSNCFETEKTVLLIKIVFKNLRIEESNPPQTFISISKSSMFSPYSSSSMNVLVLMLNVCPGGCGGFVGGMFGSRALWGPCCPGGTVGGTGPCWTGPCPGARGAFGLSPCCPWFGCYKIILVKAS